MNSGFERRPNDPTAASGSVPSPPPPGGPHPAPDESAQTEEFRRTDRHETSAPAQQLNFAAGARPLASGAADALAAERFPDSDAVPTQEFASTVPHARTAAPTNADAAQDFSDHVRSARQDAPPSSGAPQGTSDPMPLWQSAAATTPLMQQQRLPTGPGPSAAPRPEQPWQLGPASPQANSSWNGPQHPPTSTYEVPPYRPAEGGGNRTAWVFGGIGALVVVALAVTVALIVSGRNSPESGAPAAGPSMVSALTSGKGAPPTTRPSPAAPVPSAVAPLVPGYQVVSIPERGAAYDVPQDWKIDPLGTAVWGSPPDSVDIAGLTQDGKDYCPSYTRTNTFLTMSPQRDPGAAATDVGARMAKVGWASTAVTAGAVEPLESLDGQLHGSFVETTGTAPPPAPGCAATFSVYTFAFPSENGSFVMTIAADTGVDKAVDKPTAKRVLASIRPLPDR
ncbi:hypothetical protein [Nocardia blacklockiae]|uniref:hypothetical protein n=1 Tax=Nocardia blacklockiae TaxID=480036 RepID=UPI00189312FE|nr:hypothetical protein [Nocardia blacklockiae]MBF6173270.1 hypothetical protein [Nocardia blacklockiae]